MPFKFVIFFRFGLLRSIVPLETRRRNTGEYEYVYESSPGVPSHPWHYFEVRGALTLGFVAAFKAVTGATRSYKQYLK